MLATAECAATTPLSVCRTHRFALVPAPVQLPELVDAHERLLVHHRWRPEEEAEALQQPALLLPIPLLVSAPARAPPAHAGQATRQTPRLVASGASCQLALEHMPPEHAATWHLCSSYALAFSKRCLP